MAGRGVGLAERSGWWQEGDESRMGGHPCHMLYTEWMPSGASLVKH